MIRQVNAPWWYRLNGGSRAALASGKLPWGWFPLVNEYPKAGASWLAQMLAEALELPFPRNRLPHVTSCLLHGHYKPDHIGTDTVLVHRDGRDVMVSYYFHRIVGNEHTDKAVEAALRDELKITNPQDILANLPRFIEANAKGRMTPGYGWADFIAMWRDKPKVRAVTTYERLKADAAGTLQSVVRSLGRELPDQRATELVERFSFETQSKRKAGDENKESYLRKGIVGDWRNQFTAEAAQTFDHYMGDALVDLGYEPDRQWVASVR